MIILKIITYWLTHWPCSASSRVVYATKKGKIQYINYKADRELIRLQIVVREEYWITSELALFITCLEDGDYGRLGRMIHHTKTSRAETRENARRLCPDSKSIYLHPFIYPMEVSRYRKLMIVQTLTINSYS